MNPMKNAKSLFIGLAIFSMFFGAGNLIFAVNVGKEFQNLTPYALMGFVITAVILPIVGIVSILLFEGNYHKFFSRIGKTPGFVLCLFCFIIIGPGVAIPRIVTLSHIMIEPFFAGLSLPLFSVIFLTLTFLLAVTEGRIIDILGKIISPILLSCLAVAFVAATLKAPSIEHIELAFWPVFFKNLEYGYNTLDFLTSMFFASIVISILLKANPIKPGESIRSLTSMGFKGSIIGVSILGLVYIGLAFLGAAYGSSDSSLNEAEIFRSIAYDLLGSYGSIFICAAVLLACLSTSIALSALSAEYFQKVIFVGKIRYEYMLILALIIAGALSNLGLTAIIELSKPFIAIAHPVVIVLAFLNILYALFGFSYVKLPILIAFVVSVWLNGQQIIDIFRN